MSNRGVIGSSRGMMRLPVGPTMRRCQEMLLMDLLSAREWVWVAMAPETSAERIKNGGMHVK